MEKIEWLYYPENMYIDDKEWYPLKYVRWVFFHKGKNRKIERSMGVASNSKEKLTGIGMVDHKVTSFEVHFKSGSEDIISDIVSKRKWLFKKIAMYVLENYSYEKMWIDGKKFPVK